MHCVVISGGMKESAALPRNRNHCGAWGPKDHWFSGRSLLSILTASASSTHASVLSSFNVQRFNLEFTSEQPWPQPAKPELQLPSMYVWYNVGLPSGGKV